MVEKEGRGKKDEGRGKKDDGRGKKDEGRGKKDEGRGKKDEERKFCQDLGKKVCKLLQITHHCYKLHTYFSIFLLFLRPISPKSQKNKTTINKQQ